MGRRLLVFDRTCLTSGRGLSPVWMAGARLYRALGRIDASLGVADWDEALGWLAAQPGPVAEIQYWGHGTWGTALVGEDHLDVGALSPASPRRDQLRAIAERLTPDALVWFRTCETFGAARGIDFAERLADLLGARVAGHTYAIAYHQSGLHGVAPGVRADWSSDEGLVEGTADAPRRAHMSSARAPRTITCLSGRVPPAWFAASAPTSGPSRATRAR